MADATGSAAPGTAATAAPSATAAPPATEAPAAPIAPVSAPAAAMTNGSTPRQSYFQDLNDNEQAWKVKAPFRLFLVIIDIIGIGATASLVNRVGDNYVASYDYGYDNWLSPWGLIPLGISFIFCTVWLLVLFLRRPPRAMHPGIAVGIDLFLWLAFIITATFALLNLIYSDHDEPYYDYGSGYTGEYVKAPNGTYVFDMTNIYKSSAYNYTTGTYDASDIVRSCPGYDSCAEQDKQVNDLLHARHNKYNVGILSDIVQWLCVLMHFTLFVWACVDTNRYNRRESRRQYEYALAAVMGRQSVASPAGVLVPSKFQ